MTITYEYRHLGKPCSVHRATEPANAPIGQETPETAARLWDRIRKVEHNNNQAAARIRQLETERPALPHVVECKSFAKFFEPIAAFNCIEAAEHYKAECAKVNRIFEYRINSLGEGR